MIKHKHISTPKEIKALSKKPITKIVDDETIRSFCKVTVAKIKTNSNPHTLRDEELRDFEDKCLEKIEKLQITLSSKDSKYIMVSYLGVIKDLFLELFQETKREPVALLSEIKPENGICKWVLIGNLPKSDSYELKVAQKYIKKEGDEELEENRSKVFHTDLAPSGYVISAGELRIQEGNIEFNLDSGRFDVKQVYLTTEEQNEHAERVQKILKLKLKQAVIPARDLFEEFKLFNPTTKASYGKKN